MTVRTVQSSAPRLMPWRNSMPPVQPIPEALKGAVPMLILRDAVKAIDFYRQVFGAEEVARLTDPSGRIAHAELKIGDALFMMAEERPPANSSPLSLNGTSVILHVYVKDVDALFARAVAAGCKVIYPLSN